MTATASFTLDDARRAVITQLAHAAEHRAPGLYECTACERGQSSDPGFMCPDCRGDAAAAAGLVAAMEEVRGARTAEEILAVIIAATPKGDELWH